jgi:hypothetical protein
MFVMTPFAVVNVVERLFELVTLVNIQSTPEIEVALRESNKPELWPSLTDSMFLISKLALPVLLVDRLYCKALLLTFKLSTVSLPLT